MADSVVAKSILKRGIDIACAVILLILFAPLLLLLALLVRLNMGSPVLFRQVRPGLGGREFVMVKFRSMRDSHAADGSPLSDEVRMTKLGQVMRSLSLDELPELWNVLRGDMSLVGPRPLLPQYLSRYSPEQARRHDARPGITGWAQVNGRNALDWEERFKLDVWYVDNWSLALDAKILLLTLVKVLKRDGVSHSGHVTMPEFMGVSSDEKEVASK
ncbi:sugar transferase [Kamptonema cortianum]|nr:sugar transferase [Geitlerinema splendidum]MDK3155261.1 sugar transferase [Kamptonema cortianum]